MEKIIDLIGRVIFGKIYDDGFAKEQSKKKDKYVLTSVFPNEKVMKEVYSILQEQEKIG